MPSVESMPAVASESLLRQLHWRYAVKKFDPAKKIPDAQWAALEQAAVLSPSSFGLQPWKFLVIRDPQVREKLKGASWGQSQVTDASHLVIFALKTKMGEPDVQKLIDRTIELRGGTPGSLDSYKQMMVSSLGRMGDQIDAWSARQVYLALGNFLTSAAMLGIDACPMEGFDPAQHNQILGLTEKGYSAVVMATAGYRAADDKYAAAPKVRFKAEDVIEHV